MGHGVVVLTMVDERQAPSRHLLSLHVRRSSSQCKLLSLPSKLTAASRMLLARPSQQHLSLSSGQVVHTYRILLDHHQLLKQTVLQLSQRLLTAVQVGTEEEAVSGRKQSLARTRAQHSRTPHPRQE